MMANLPVGKDFCRRISKTSGWFQGLRCSVVVFFLDVSEDVPVILRAFCSSLKSGNISMKSGSLLWQVASQLLQNHGFQGNIIAVVQDVCNAWQ